MSIKHKDDVTTMSKKHEQMIAGIIDFLIRNPDFSASMLERGISRSWGGSWLRFWVSWEGLEVVLGHFQAVVGRPGSIRSASLGVCSGDAPRTWTLVGRFWPKLDGLENYLRFTVGGGLIIL